MVLIQFQAACESVAPQIVKGSKMKDFHTVPSKRALDSKLDPYFWVSKSEE